MTSVENTEQQPKLDDKEKLSLQIIYFGAIGSALISIIPVLAIVGIVVWIGLLAFAYVKRGDQPSDLARTHYSNFITVFCEQPQTFLAIRCQVNLKCPAENLGKVFLRLLFIINEKNRMFRIIGISTHGKKVCQGLEERTLGKDS